MVRLLQQSTAILDLEGFGLTFRQQELVMFTHVLVMNSDIGDLNRFLLSCLGPFGFLTPKDLSYLALSVPDEGY